MDMGYLAAISGAPALLFGLLAGPWVDRFRRRTLMIVCDIARAAILLTIPIAALAGILRLPQLYVVSFVAGIFSVFFDTAFGSYLPSLITRRQLIEGNSKLTVSGSITGIAGPSLAGVLIQLVTAPFAVALDALSFLASAFFLYRIRRREAKARSIRDSLLRQIIAGIGLIIRDRRLRAFACCLATSNLSSNIFFALYMLYGTSSLGLNAAQLGLAYGIGASGALLAATVTPKLSQRVGIGRATIIGAILGSMEVVPAAAATPNTAIVLLTLSSLIGNFGWVVFNINQASVSQAVTPRAYLGRMNATMAFLVAGMLPLGSLIGGVLGQTIGLRESIAVSAIGSGVSFLWLLFSPVAGLRRLDSALRSAQRKM
jgi:MFS family permease